MKKATICAAIITFTFAFSTGPALSDPDSPDAREILERTIERDYQDMELTLHLVKVSKKGRERPMDLVVKSKKTEEATKSLAEFTSPIEVEGMKALTWDYPESGVPSDQWFMLAGMDTYMKCRGKACSKMEDQFGFSADTFNMDLDDADHELKGIEDVGGAACYKIESIAKDPVILEDMARLLIWVDKEKMVARKIEAFDKDGTITHASAFTEFKKLTDRWWETKGEMTKVKSGKKMRFEIKEAKINAGIPDEVFAKPAKFTVKEDEGP